MLPTKTVQGLLLPRKSASESTSSVLGPINITKTQFASVYTNVFII